MAIGPRLDLRQSQQLVMTPQLQQAIKLLALSNLELESYINSELEKNPLLEAAGEGQEPTDTPADTADFDGEEPRGSDELIASGGGEIDAPLDVDHSAETFHHDCASDMPAASTGGLDGALSVTGAAVAGSGGDDDGEGFEATLTADLSLHDTLIAQIISMETWQQIVARHIIDLIDEAGYFTGDVADIAARLELAPSAVASVLALVHGFEPTGVGARSLSECLALQAKEADRYDPAMAALIDNLDLLARGEMATLRRICGVDSEDLADMIGELRGYNPKPGLVFGGDRPQPIMPDIFVARTASGGWAVEINSATLPRLLVNRSYYAELAAGPGNRESRTFLSECLASANWLVKALDQRQRTIVKVATELVRQQEAFFINGVQKLKPLNLRAIADAIGMHESTVSRVTSNKYLSCERGLFELKYFFTSAIQAYDGGDAVSAEAVKTTLKDLIDGEGQRILSDDKLVELLNAAGFDIARRTVAKYREALGIGSSVERRRAAAIDSAAA